VAWEKVACWSTKAAISLKGVKIEEKLLWRAYRNSPRLFRTVPSRPPDGLLFPKIGVRNPHPKLQSLLSQERVKLYRLQFWAVHSQSPSEQKPIKNCGERGAYMHIHQGLSNFLKKVPPIIPGTGKGTNFKFCTHIHRIDRNKSPLKISGKVL